MGNNHPQPLDWLLVGEPLFCEILFWFNVSCPFPFHKTVPVCNRWLMFQCNEAFAAWSEHFFYEMSGHLQKCAFDLATYRKGYMMAVCNQTICCNLFRIAITKRT